MMQLKDRRQLSPHKQAHSAATWGLSYGPGW